VGPSLVLRLGARLLVLVPASWRKHYKLDIIFYLFKEPLPKPGRGIQRTSASGLTDWSTRLARGTLKEFSSPSPLPPLPNNAQRFQSPPSLETLESPFTESARRLARSVRDRTTTPFNTVDTTQ
jgi:hypothetical protein